MAFHAIGRFSHRFFAVVIWTYFAFCNTFIHHSFDGVFCLGFFFSGWIHRFGRTNHFFGVSITRHFQRISATKKQRQTILAKKWKEKHANVSPRFRKDYQNSNETLRSPGLVHVQRKYELWRNSNAIFLQPTKKTYLSTVEYFQCLSFT